MLAGGVLVFLLLTVAFAYAQGRVHRNAEGLARSVMTSIASGATVPGVPEETAAAVRRAGPAALRLCDRVGVAFGAVECIFDLAGGRRAELLVDGEAPRLVAIAVRP